MNSKKGVYLFLALLLPVCVFLFLKIFGKNEFAVKPLYVDEYPKSDGCQSVNMLPYVIPDSIRTVVSIVDDSLTVLFFGALKNESANQYTRIKDEIGKEPMSIRSIPESDRTQFWKRCVFFLHEPMDVVLLDRRGVIRGNYTASDRDEMDRLLTEITIILKKY